MGSGSNLKQEFVPYWKWECYNSGMWNKVNRHTEKTMLPIAIEFTSNHELYGSAMVEVSKLWKHSMCNFLTNKSINRKAYIGHCAVFLKKQIPEYIVRAAWKHLTNEQQILANLEAEKTIKLWEKERLIKSIDTFQNGNKDVIGMVYQTKLQFR